MRTVRAIRYLTPLREGGSVPAIVEADDDGTYVAKFSRRGAGPARAGRRAHRRRDRPLARSADPPLALIVQTSPVHTGLCDEPSAALDQLVRRLVLPLAGERDQ